MHIKLKSILTESINEIDWKSDDLKDIDPSISGSKTRCMSMQAVKDWLSSELDRYESGGKAAKNMPRLTGTTVRGLVVKDESGTREVKIDQFIRILSTPPKTIFDVGEKSLHTGDKNTMTINTGIPALRGIIWDPEARDFKIINTCPSAGSCAVDCYALQGFYIMNDGKNLKLAQRLQLILEKPSEYIEQAFREARRLAQDAKWDNKILEIRWNDAGDFFSDRYFQSAMAVTRQLLEAGFPIKSYFYTKMGKFVELGQQMGIEVTYSLGGTDQVKDAKKKSVIVPSLVFRKFLTSTKGRGFEKDPESGKTKITPEAGEGLRQAVFDEYKNDPEFKELNIDTIKYTDEMPSKEDDERKYSCIILPGGDSDRPAQRKDVKHVFLLKH
jgi:Gene product 88